MSRIRLLSGPLSPANLLAGLIVTVVGGVLVAVIVQDARFASKPSSQTPFSMTTPEPLWLDTGAFHMSRPAIFTKVRALNDEYAFSFESDDSAHSGFVRFRQFYDRAMSEPEWKAYVSNVLSIFPVEVGSKPIALMKHQITLESSRVAEGHRAYFECRIDSSNQRMLLFVAESEGIVLDVFFIAPAEEWTEFRPTALTSIDSITWKPEDIKIAIAGRKN